MSIERLLNSDEEFRTLTSKQKVKLAAYSLYVLNKSTEFLPKDIVSFMKHQKLDAPKNIPRELSLLAKEKPRDIFKAGKVYVLDKAYIKTMEDKTAEPKIAQVSVNLQSLLLAVHNPSQKDFINDALKCIAAKVFRPAIILTWMAVMDFLYDLVINEHLLNFNTELTKANKKLSIRQKSDFEDIKEGVFIELLRSSAIISKEQKKILDEKLTIRNSAAHPNQTSFKENKVISFIEELIVDVIEKFTPPPHAGARVPRVL